MKTGIELIAEERQRQIEVEGWTPEHDAEHEKEEIALAAACYVTPSNNLEYKSEGFFGSERDFKVPKLWPWDDEWYKPALDDGKESRIRELQKAGALIAAEIDRLNNIKKQTK